MIKLIDSTPSPTAVGQWLCRQYAIGKRVQVRVFAKRTGCLYEVKTPKMRYFLKLLPSGESSFGELQVKAAVLEAAAKAGVKVQAPLRTRAGKGCAVLQAPEGKRLALLFPYMPGIIPEFGKGWNPSLRRDYGRTLGQFHLAAPAKLGRRLPKLSFDSTVGMALKNLKQCPQVDALLLKRFKSAAAWVKTELAKIPGQEPEIGAVHCDAHPGNVTGDDKDRIYLVDTELLAWGWRSYDLATLFWNACYGLRWGGKLDAKLWKEELAPYAEGYEEIRCLSSAERRAFPALMMAREFWLTGMISGPNKKSGYFYGSNANYYRQTADYLEAIKKDRAALRNWRAVHRGAPGRLPG